MGIHDQAEREIKRLETELTETFDPAERKAIRAAIREIEREVRDHDAWEEEGYRNGYF